MEPKEKIKVPAAWTAERDKEAQRRQLVAEWKQWLSARQREVLDEAPYENFRSKLPLDALKAFGSDEREELLSHEQVEFSRFRPLAQAKQTQRTGYVKAGGSAEEFNEIWNAGGREMTICEIAAGEKIEHSPDRFTSPY